MDASVEWLAVGRVRRPHGIHGEVVVDIFTDFPERVSEGVEVGIGGPDGPERVLAVVQARIHKGAWLLDLGHEDRNQVEDLRGQWLFLPAQPRAELPENYYYEHELIGLRCADAAGRELGEVTGFSGAGAGMLLEVKTARGESLVPFRSPIVVRVDLDAGTIVLDPPRGLLDGDAL